MAAARGRPRRPADRKRGLVSALAIRDASSGPDRDRERRVLDRTGHPVRTHHIHQCHGEHALPHTLSARMVDDALTNEFPPNRTSPVEIVIGTPAGSPQVRALAEQVTKLPGVSAVAPAQPAGPDNSLLAVGPGARAAERGDPGARARRAGDPCARLRRRRWRNGRLHRPGTQPGHAFADGPRRDALRRPSSFCSCSRGPSCCRSWRS